MAEDCYFHIPESFPGRFRRFFVRCSCLCCACFNHGARSLSYVLFCVNLGHGKSRSWKVQVILPWSLSIFACRLRLLPVHSGPHPSSSWSSRAAAPSSLSSSSKIIPPIKPSMVPLSPRLANNDSENLLNRFTPGLSEYRTGGLLCCVWTVALSSGTNPSTILTSMSANKSECLPPRSSHKTG